MNEIREHMGSVKPTITFFLSFSRLLGGQKVKGFVNGSVVVVEFELE